MSENHHKAESVRYVSADEGLGIRIPWWSKIAAKLILSRLPVSYGIWAQLGLFRHGLTDHDVSNAVDFQRGVFDEARATLGYLPRRVVELGPGDLLTAILALTTFGVPYVVVIDTGEYATTDSEPYVQAYRLAGEQGAAVPADSDGPAFFVEMMARTGSRYLTNGLESYADVETGSVDVVYSNAVLEHVRCHEFAQTLAQMHRVLAPGGVCIHQVDLKDHLSGGLNNLRFPSSVWEHALFANSGFYTNRIGYTEMVTAFADAGFDVAIKEVQMWQECPLPAQSLAGEFRDRDEDDLKVAGFRIVARRL
ncbi:MAG: methyltransferase domain-containing protein [Candidatus Phaeomarinobacter sp.]